MNDWLTITEKFADLVHNLGRDIVQYPHYHKVVFEEDVPCSCNKINMPAVRQAIFNKNATIVYFNDGTKCVVHKSALDEYNREHAIVYAIVKRAYGIVGSDGVVQGNGMGSMLAKILANAVDQEATKSTKTPCKDCSHCGKTKCDNVSVKPWKTTTNTLPCRDFKGRFVKKANR